MSIMWCAKIAMVILAAAEPPICGEETCVSSKPLVLDHDGNYDDILVLLALLQRSDLDLKAVMVTPADCELDAAVEVTAKVLRMLNRSAVPVLPGRFPARYNEFPKVWRELATEMLQVADIYLQELPPLDVKEAAAHEWLERYLEAAEGPTDFVLTGPATNLNWALQRRPHLASKVGRVFWMAGAVDVDGNIRDSDDDKPQDSDGSAEWNAFWDPEGTAELLRLGLDLWLVPLDATNAVPVRKDFIQRLDPTKQVSRTAQQIWAQSKFQKSNAVYYMWDTLTVGLYLQPTLCSWETMPLQGHASGKEQGRISRAKNSSSGTKVVNVAKVTDVPAFVEFLLSLFNR